MSREEETRVMIGVLVAARSLALESTAAAIDARTPVVSEALSVVESAVQAMHDSSAWLRWHSFGRAAGYLFRARELAAEVSP